MRKLLISILSVMILGVVAAQASDFLLTPKAVKVVRKGINLLKDRLREDGITLPHWGEGRWDIPLQMSIAKNQAEVLTSNYGSLQNVVTNLQIPSGTISNKVDWATLIYQGNKYLLTSKDVYECYYRLYQLISFRIYYSWGMNGNIKFTGETKSGLSAYITNFFLKKDVYKKNLTLAAPILVGLYSRGNRIFVKKAIFDYILFTGTMLNKLSNDSFAKKYFSKYERDWAKLRAILNKIKEEDSKK